MLLYIFDYVWQIYTIYEGHYIYIIYLKFKFKSIMLYLLNYIKNNIDFVQLLSTLNYLKTKLNRILYQKRKSLLNNKEF